MLLVAATAWWLGRLIAENWNELRGFSWRENPGLLIASVAAHVAVLAFGVWVWNRVLRCFEHPPVGLGTLQRIWFLSNLARYVPGKVFQFIAVAQLSRGAGLSGGMLLTSMLVHTGITLLSSAVVAAWTIAGGIVPSVDPLWPRLASAAGAILAVHPALLNRLLAVIPRVLKKDVIRWNGRWRDGIALLGLSIVNWLLYGAAYHLFLAALADVPWRLLPQMAGVNALSFLVGYVSPLPGGTGLRELSMTILLRPYLPDGVSAVLAIASRLWTIAAELLGGGLVLLLVRRRTPFPAGGDVPAGNDPAPPQP